MVYFGVDAYDDPELTYYQCRDGNCSEIYDMKCTRTCDDKEFNFNKVNVALLQVSNQLLCGIFSPLMPSLSSNLSYNPLKPLPSSVLSPPSYHLIPSS